MTMFNGKNEWAEFTQCYAVGYNNCHGKNCPASRSTLQAVFRFLLIHDSVTQNKLYSKPTICVSFNIFLCILYNRKLELQKQS